MSKIRAKSHKNMKSACNCAIRYDSSDPGFELFMFKLCCFMFKFETLTRLCLRFETESFLDLSMCYFFNVLRFLDLN